MIKLDVLKLLLLSVAQYQNTLIQKYYNTKLDLNDLCLTDDKTWDLLCSCDTLGVFQMESEIGKGIIRKIQPRNLEELSSINAFIRPGTSGLDNYVYAKKDIRKKKLYHPIIDNILTPTYGSIIYQETIMSLISAMMGMSFGKADILRRALEKPNKKGNAEKVEYFKDNCVKLGMEHGISKEACESIKQEILDNAGYLFNKSHSIAYSYLTYEMAYLKANYPLIFYLSSLIYESTDKLQAYMSEARKKGITILPPHVLKSKYESTIEDKDKKIIRAGLQLIKGLGEKSIEDILLTQQEDIKTLNDYFAKARSSKDEADDTKKGKGKAISKSALEPLIKIGAMSDLPLLVDKSAIINEDDFIINNANDEQVYVTLNRLQQEIWLKEYLELKAKKTEHKFAVPMSMIRGRYLQNYDEGDLIVEADETIVIPESALNDFGFIVDDVMKYKTRKTAKGIFKKDNGGLKRSKEQIAFSNVYDKLKHVKINNTTMYLEDLRDFELSFIPHPLNPIADKIPLFESFKEGQSNAFVAGIVLSILTKKTKTNKDYYIVTVLAPFESVRVIMWQETMKRNASKVVIGNIIKVLGKASQQFGSLTADRVELVNIKS